MSEGTGWRCLARASDQQRRAGASWRGKSMICSESCQDSKCYRTSMPCFFSGYASSKISATFRGPSIPRNSSIYGLRSINSCRNWLSHQRGSAHLDTRRQRTTHRRQPHHTTCEARRTSASSRTLNALRLHTTPLEMLPTTFLSRLSRDSPRIPCGVTAGSVL